MTFVNAVKTCLTKYVVFSGRASRSEFWWFVLFVNLVTFTLYWVYALVLGTEFHVSVPVNEDGIRIGQPVQSVQYNGGLLWLIFLAAMVLPLTAVSWRRMHDVGRPGYLPLAMGGVAVFVVAGALALTFAPIVTNVQGYEMTIPNYEPVGILVAVMSAISAFVVNTVLLCEIPDPETNAYGPNPDEVSQ